MSGIEQQNVPITYPGTGAGNCNPGDPTNQQTGCSQQAIDNAIENCAKHESGQVGNSGNEPATCYFDPGR